MKAFKITISTIVVILLLVFLVLPLGVGLYVKHSYKKILSTIPVTPDASLYVKNSNKKIITSIPAKKLITSTSETPNVSVKVESFDLGWFYSRATIVVDLHPKGATSSYRIVFYSRIQQGPIILPGASSGSKKTIFALAKIINAAPSINFKSTAIWHFSNKVISNFSSPNINVDVAGFTLKVKGLQGVAAYQLGTKKWDIIASINSLSLTSADPQRPLKTLTLNGIRYSGKVHRVGLIGYGKQTIQINSLVAQVNNTRTNTTDSLAINNLALISDVTNGKNTTNLQLIFNINKLENTDLGINSVTINIAFNDIDTKMLNALLKTTRAQSTNTSDQVALAEVTKSSLGLLRKGLTVKIDKFKVGTSEGTVDVSGSLILPKLSNKANITAVALDASANFKLLIPKTWLVEQMTHVFTFLRNANPSRNSPGNQATTLIKQWEDQQYLNTQGNYYTSTITYKNGILLINGKVPDVTKKTSVTSTRNIQY